MTKIRFEHHPEGRISGEFGPFEWVQFRYGELVTSPDGEPFAYTDAEGLWHIHHDEVDAYTDIVVWGEREAEDRLIDADLFAPELAGYAGAKAAVYLREHWATCDPPLDAQTKRNDVYDVIEALRAWAARIDTPRDLNA